MNEKKLSELLETLFELKYGWSSGSSSYISDVIHEEGRLVVEDIIRKYLLDSHDEKTGILEAKVFMYEKIISKSNFAPMLEDATADIRNFNLKKDIDNFYTFLTKHNGSIDVGDFDCIEDAIDYYLENK